MTLKEQIRANRWRTLWLLILFAALAGVIGAIAAFLYDPSIFIVVAIVAFTYAIFSWFAAGRMVAGLTGAKPADRAQYPRVYHVLETVCIAAGIEPVPPLYVIDDPAPNAFAAGRNQ
jgi:heat shock protein HtpX